MGNYLKKPRTDKKSVVEKSLQNHWFCGASIMQGWRVGQEDAYDFNLNFMDGAAFFAVYDGHGGAAVCNYVKMMLPKIIQANWDSADIPKTLITSFLQLDSSLLSDSVLQEIEKIDESDDSSIGYVDKDDVMSEIKTVCNTFEDTEETDSDSVNVEDDSSSEKNENSANSDDIKSTEGESSDKDNLNNGSLNANLNENCKEHEAGESSNSEAKTCNSEDQDVNSATNEEKDHEKKLECSQPNFSNLLETYQATHNPVLDSGCTASVVIIHKDTVYCAHVGDSYCYLYETDAIIPLCEEVTPESPSELQRIKKAGGYVSDDGRVASQLNLSRALGDFSFKGNKDLPPEEQMISPMPFVKSVPVTKEFKFIILASDGIWNSSKNVHDYLKRNFRNCEVLDQLSDLVENLFEECLAKKMTNDGTGCDNMTAILVSNQSAMKENDSPVAKKPRLE